MGLDLYLYRAGKGENIEIDWDKMSDEMDELSYGRKTWTIYHKFKELGATPLKENSDAVLVVTPLVYERFINSIFEAMEDLNLTPKKLRKALKVIRAWNLADEDEDFEDDGRLGKSVFRIGNFLSAWSDVTTQLGSEWEVSAILRWLDDREKVRAAFEEGYNVILVASY